MNKRLKRLLKEGVGSIMEVKKGELFIISDLDVSMEGDRKIVIDALKKSISILEEGKMEKYADELVGKVPAGMVAKAMNSPELAEMFGSFFNDMKKSTGFEPDAKQQEELKAFIINSIADGVSKDEVFAMAVYKLNSLYVNAFLAGKVGTVEAAPVQGELNFAKELGCDTCENREECDSPMKGNPVETDQFDPIRAEEERELSEIEAYRKRRRELRADVREMLNEVLGEGNYSFSLTRKFGKEEEEAQMEQAAGAIMGMQ